MMTPSQKRSVGRLLLEGMSTSEVAEALRMTEIEVRATERELKEYLWKTRASTTNP